MNLDISLLNRPYYLYRDRKHRWIIALLIAGFVWFFLFVFGIFDFDYFQPFRRLYLTGIYAFCCWLTLILNFLVVQDYLIKKLTVGNTLLFSLWFMFCIGCSNFILTTLVFQWEAFSWMVFLKNQFYTLAIGLVIAPFCILAHYSYILRKRSNNTPLSISDLTDTILLLESDYRNGNIELDLGDLLYIQSADNYIDIYYLQGNSVKHHLLRNTLAKIEKQVNYLGIIRCHRSYMVNLHHISFVMRATNSLRLELPQHVIDIPVSRKYRDTVLTTINKMM